ncbi:MAG: MFS transporter [Acidimicrobiales bacterium]
MKVAAANAIADSVRADELCAEWVVPSVFDKDVPLRVAEAVYRGDRRRCVTAEVAGRSTAHLGIWRRGPLPLYFAAYILLGFGMSVLGPAIPTLREATGASNGGISILFPAVSAGGFVGALTVGRLYDQGHGHRLLGAGLAAFGLAALVLSVPSTVVVLAVIIFLLGLVGSAIDVGGNTLLLWHGGTGWSAV